VQGTGKTGVTYQPSETIPADATFKFSVINGKLKGTEDHNLTLCDGTEVLATGTYDGSADKNVSSVTLTVPDGKQLSSGTAYTVYETNTTNSCGNPVTSKLPWIISTGSTEVNVAITDSSAAGGDASAVKVLSVKNQFSANVTGVTTAKLDVSDSQKKFTAGTNVTETVATYKYTLTSDETIDDQVTVAGLTDSGCVTTASTTFDFTLTGDMTGLKELDAGAGAHTITTAEKTAKKVSAISVTDTSTAICGKSATTKEENDMNVTAKGDTAMVEGSFNITAKWTNIGGTLPTEPTLISNTKVLTFALDSNSIKVPYMVSNSDTETYVRINNKSNSLDARVTFDVTDDNGVAVTGLAVTPADENGTATDVSKLNARVWAASAILAKAQASNASFAANGKFRAVINVTVPDGDASAVAIMTVNGGRDRVIPVSSK